jgi:hypothetical protein
MGEKGGVQHMTVTFAAPGAALVLRGPLGPFYDAPVEGVLKWSLKKTSTGTDVSMSFRASGSFKNGFEAISPAVDKVLTDQSDRLKKYLETKNSVP